MRYKRILFTLCISAGYFMAFAQAQNKVEVDTVMPKQIYLKEISIVGIQSKSDIHQLPHIVGTQVFAGKKNALIVMDNLNANVVNNAMRQVMAKVPGIHVWESDGSGIHRHSGEKVKRQQELGI